MWCLSMTTALAKVPKYRKFKTNNLSLQSFPSLLRIVTPSDSVDQFSPQVPFCCQLFRYLVQPSDRTSASRSIIVFIVLYKHGKYPVLRSNDIHLFYFTWIILLVTTVKPYYQHYHLNSYCQTLLFLQYSEFCL